MRIAVRIACENIRAKSEEKRMFSQATVRTSLQVYYCGGVIQAFLDETVSLTPKAHSNLPTVYAFNTFSKLSLRLVNVIHYHLVYLSDIDCPAFFNSF